MVASGIAAFGAKKGIGEEEEGLYGGPRLRADAGGYGCRARGGCRPWIVVLILTVVLLQLIAVPILIGIGFSRVSSLEEKLAGRQGVSGTKGDDALGSGDSVSGASAPPAVESEHLSLDPTRQGEYFVDSEDEDASGFGESPFEDQEKTTDSDDFDENDSSVSFDDETDGESEVKLRSRRSIAERRNKKPCKGSRCLKNRIKSMLSKKVKPINDKMEEISKSVRELHRSLGDGNAHAHRGDLSAIHMRMHVFIQDLTRRLIDQDDKSVLIGTIGSLNDQGFRPNGYRYNFWKEADWYNDEASDYRLENNTELIIETGGVYMIYAQVLYHEHYFTASFNLTLERSGVAGPLSTCVNSIRDLDDRDSDSLFRPCQVMTIRRLNRLDKLYIEDRQRKRVYRARGSDDQEPAETSYWGLVKLAHL